MRAPLSVIMTVHNGERYLRESVSTVLAQTYRDFELVVVDDGSIDDSLPILRSFDDPRIRVVSVRQPIGRTPALNLALEEAVGEFVAVQDADDVSMLQRLEDEVAYMETHLGIALLGTWAEFINSDGSHVDFFRPPSSHREIVRASIDQNPFVHSSVIYRRKAALSVGGYPREYVYAQDFALWLKLMRDYQVANLPSQLVQLRVHSDQMTQLPQLRLSRSLEGIRLLELASSHPDLLGHPKSTELARSMLVHAQALSESGRYPEAWLWLIRACLVRSPGWLRETENWKTVIKTMLGQRGTSIMIAAKHRLKRWFKTQAVL